MVKGRDDDETVMIIGDHTIKIRELCTSNTFLIVDKETGMVEETTSNILEAIHFKADLERVKQLLRQFPFEGINQMDPEGLEALEKEILPGIIQASTKDFESALKTNHAFLYNDHYRILGSNFICRFFELFFTTALLEDWSYATEVLSRQAVKRKFMEDFYDEFNESLLEQVFLVFDDPEHYTENMDDWKVSEKKVCRFYANELLKARHDWLLTDLLQAWKKLVGDFLPDISMLRGLAILDDHPVSGQNEFRVTYFSVEDLPSNPQERFKLLFQTRPRWQYDDLLPFIEGLAESESKLQSIIIKFCRRSTDAGTGRTVVTTLIPL